MSEMKTRVARAIWDEMRGRAGVKHFFLHVEGKPTEGAFEDHQGWLEEVAGSLIRAMREPTPAMTDAGGNVDIEPAQGDWTQDIGDSAADRAWKLMIDEAAK